MSESFVNPLFGQHVQPSTDARPEPEGATGHEDVDAVVASLSGLDHLPVDEHVAVFEQAHERLGRTLADAGPTQPAAVRS